MSRKPVKLGTWEMLRPHDEEGITDYSDLNRRTHLPYRHPRVPGLEEECRELKNSLSIHTCPHAHIRPRGLVQPVLPGLFGTRICSEYALQETRMDLHI